jgi:hypothetical protein
MEDRPPVALLWLRQRFSRPDWRSCRAAGLIWPNAQMDGSVGHTSHAAAKMMAGRGDLTVRTRTPTSSHGTPPITGPFTSSFMHSG